MSEILQDLDQPLRVLIRARARGVRRLNLGIAHLRRRDRWLAPGWPEPEVDHIRRHCRVADERRMQLQREIAPRHDRVDREDVRARPGARRLAERRLAVDPQLQIDARVRIHGHDATACGSRVSRPRRIGRHPPSATARRKPDSRGDGCCSGGPESRSTNLRFERFVGRLSIAATDQRPSAAPDGEAAVSETHMCIARLLKTSTAGRHYRNAGAKEKRAVVRGALSDVGRFDSSRARRPWPLLPRVSGTQGAMPPSRGQLVLSKLVLAAERISANGPRRRGSWWRGTRVWRPRLDEPCALVKAGPSRPMALCV